MDVGEIFLTPEKAKRHYSFPMVEVKYEDENGKTRTKMMRDITDLISKSHEIEADNTYERDPVLL